MAKEPDYQHNKRLDKYIKKIGKIAVLSADEEIALAKRIHSGNQEAFEKLVKSNLRFVVKIAMEYRDKGLSLDDLINEGTLGLMGAAKRFDETRGFKFISFAVWWIRRSILKAISEHQRIVRLPVTRISKLSKIAQAYSKLEQENERDPNLEELAAELKMSAETVAETLQVSKFAVSLEMPNSYDGKFSLLDTIQDLNNDIPGQSLENDSLKSNINEVISTLTPKQAAVVRLYFGIDQERAQSLEEIGEKLGVTSERVRQLKEMALQRLRHSSRCNVLRDFLRA